MVTETSSLLEPTSALLPMSTASEFIAGLVTALVLSTLIVLLFWQRNDAMRRLEMVAGRGRETIARVLPGLSLQERNSERKSQECVSEIKGADLRAATTSEEGEGLEASGTPENNKSVVMTESKPFSFRKRLWHEAPEGYNLENDYTSYSHYDAVQKELKTMGGKDLAWKTNWLDLQIESSLLQDYQDWARRWARRRRRGEKFPVEETVFYRGLHESIRMDYFEVLHEMKLNDACYGKTWGDLKEMRKFTASVRDREESKKTKGEETIPDSP